MASSVSSVRSRPEREGEAPSVDLRASVLEAAISVGFRNSVMKKWMFDPMMEGDEDEHAEHTASTPALTSPSTSEESSMSPYSLFCPPGKVPGFKTGVVDPYPLFMNNNANLSQAALSHEDIASFGNQKGGGGGGGVVRGGSPFGKLSLSIGPPPKNKLRKQRSAYTEGIGNGNGNANANGYESDGGYVSDFTKKVKAKKSLGWRNKVKGTGTGVGNGDEDGGSDGGYRSEAVPSSSVSLSSSKTKRKAAKDKNKDKDKDKNREKELQTLLQGNRDSPVPPLPPPSLPPMELDDRDPGALLETIKASVLPEPKYTLTTTTTTSSSPAPLEFVSAYLPGPGSSSGHGHSIITMTTDGYATDSEKRGRSKKKTKTGRTTNKSKTRATSPSSASTESASTPVSKKKSLFRLMGRSLSRDAKDRDRAKVEEEPPPLPELRPPMPLPIAERFARSGTATPVGNASASVTSGSPTLANSEIGLTKALSSLELRSSGSLDTLVPPPRFNELGRSDSPWSNRSAPGRIGAVGGGGGGGSVIGERAGSGSASLELPRERKDSSDLSPYSFVQRPENGATAGNGEKEYEPEHKRRFGKKANGQVSQNDVLPLSRTISPIVTTANTASTSGSPDLGRSPTKRIGKLFIGLVHSSNNVDSSSTSPSSSKPPPPPPISVPNPHLTRGGSASLRVPNPLELAAALTSSTRANGNGNVKSAVDGRPITPESFIIIDEDESVPTTLREQRFRDATANEPSSSSLNVTQSTTTVPPSPSTARRRALLNGLGLDITPTQSRSGTPIPGSNPNEDEVKAARASVLAYYQVPPPSPPPTGPLPAPPQESEMQLLSPGRAFASRSPSPLGIGARYSRSPSPGMGMGFGVRRGRESPFPTRPILPPQDSRQLVERVERYKALYATDGTGSDERFEDEAGWERQQELIDKHGSEYIRQARARGEKRVYFDVRRSYIRHADVPIEVDDDAYHDDGVVGDTVIPEIEVDPAEGTSEYNDDFDDQSDERLRYSKQPDSPTKIRELLKEGLKPEEEEDGDRRSFASSSVYSRYSVLDADKSAKFRDGLVRGVAVMYGQDDGRLLREEIPEVPKLPPELRAAAMGKGGAVAGIGATAAGQLGRTELKISSSPYRF